MVLGLRSKHRKGNSVQVDYQVHVKEIKPWPPSETLRSVQSVLLQWDNGDQNFGSLSSNVGDDRIEFNNSFTLTVTLHREKKSQDSFQKNCLEFYLYEPRKDKASKGHLLGTSIINLADYGILKESLIISAPLNYKKSSKNTSQPVLFVNLEPFDRESSNSSPKSSLSKDASLDNDGGESVSEMMTEENDDESEIASFTDDDESSHSSLTNSSSNFGTTKGSGSSQNRETRSGTLKGGTGRDSGEQALPSVVEPPRPVVILEAELFKQPYKNSRQPSSAKLSSNSVPVPQFPSSSLRYHDELEEYENCIRSLEQEVGLRDSSEEKSDGTRKIKQNTQKLVNGDTRGQVDVKSDPPNSRYSKNGQIGNFPEENMHSSDNISAGNVSLDPRRKHGTLRSDTLNFSRRSPGVLGMPTFNNKLKHVNSVQLTYDSSKYTRFFDDNQGDDLQDAHHSATGKPSTEMKEASNGVVDGPTEWKSRVEVLEEELREAAALEAALYSVVAEHGGSTNKVHAPARRLSRFYLHACKEKCQAKVASAARTVVSGLILVSKACGNDVPRLAFWLSNSIMLRVVINQSTKKIAPSGGQSTGRNGGGKQAARRSLKTRNEPSSNGKEKNNSAEEIDDWEDPQTFPLALEKVESWIFSRIVESVWWQTLTPRMQSTAATISGRPNFPSSKKTSNGSVMVNHEQGSFSILHWKKAFKDACERVCPIRAGGHECGCLSLLARLVMEQLVSRLDVAMFNAILRESADEMPTDPVSDPITDSNVLPVPVGKSSFGAGAQLKNAIGNWSLWLTDLFGVEDYDSIECTNGFACDASFKAFRLLNALSDLMMLPSEMLADRSTRKEVCPTLGAPLIKRVLLNFVPDEFCPDRVPLSVFEALDAEGDSETAGGSVTSFPCVAGPTIYSPPPAASLVRVLGEVGTQSLQRSGSSSVLKKSYTSDDELDALDSPLTSIVIDKSRISPVSKNPNWIPKGKGGRNVVRYQLLREVWRDNE